MRWKKKLNVANNLTPKLINYQSEMLGKINLVAEETDFNFTEVQKMINDYFFEDDENLVDVFGEVETEAETEEEEEE
jgi:hypothetical protein